MAAKFSQILLMVTDVVETAKFYSEGLGIRVKEARYGMAELDANGTAIILHHAENPQPGNSPILSFHVDDVNVTVEKLEAMGGKLEGRIREPFFGKVAAVRTPDGHLISLLQPTNKESKTSSNTPQ